MAIIGSARGLAELSDLQEGKHIQPLVKPGNTDRDICRKHGRAERRISHTQTQVDESEAITHYGFVPV